MPLDGSRVEGNALVCRWYGAAFDVETGATIRPARVPQLLTFPVAVRGGRVFVRLGDRRRPRPAEPVVRSLPRAAPVAAAAPAIP